MFNSKSKKLGLVGTIFFHFFLFVICFFSSIGYTSIIIPEGIEIAYIPDKSLFEEDNLDSKTEGEIIENKDDSKVLQEIITQESDLINLAYDEDSISSNKLEEVTEVSSISSELELAFQKINTLKSSRDSIEIFENNEEKQNGLDTNNRISNELEDGYVLSENRFAIQKIKPDYLCKETGRVVVRVWVNRDGLTIKAESGIRGTTESAACLLEEAKSAALKTTWTPYFNAPEIQIGQITYNFYRN